MPVWSSPGTPSTCRFQGREHCLPLASHGLDGPVLSDAQVETSGAATASPHGPGSVRTLDEVQCLLPRLQEHPGPECGASQGPGDNAEGGAYSQVVSAGSA